MRALLGLVALVCGLAGQVRIASAGPVEEFSQVMLDPKDPNKLVVRYQYGGSGLFHSADAGKSWKMSCASMIAPGEDGEGPMALTGDGSLLLGVFEGLWQGKDSGCSWQKAPELVDIRVTDVVAHPTEASVAFAATGRGDAPNGVYRRDAAGTWTAIGTQDEGIIVRMRAVMKGSTLRLYQSAFRGQRMVGDAGMEVPNYLIRVSDDLGMTWKEFPTDLTGGVRLEAVDPTNPDRIVVSVHRENAPDQILVSSDQGETFKDYLSITDLGGIAFAPDGRIWIGDFGNPAVSTAPRGVWTAPNLDTMPTQLTGEYQVECLSYQAATNTLYGCQRWAFGTIDQATGAFTQQLTFLTARDFVSCPGMDPPAMCKLQLCGAYCGPTHFATAPLCAVYSDPLCGPTADGPVGPPTGGPSAGGTAGTPSPSTAGTGASMAPAPSAPGGGAPQAQPAKSSGCAALPLDASSHGALLPVFVLGLCLALRRRSSISRA